jgi:serine/threonine protein kinase
MEFTRQVYALRAEYCAARDNHNLYGNKPGAYRIEDEGGGRVDGNVVSSFWLSNDKYVRLVDIPNTLSGDILRLKEDLPEIEGNFEIAGNRIRSIEAVPPRDPEWDKSDEQEDITQELEALPIIDADKILHHTKSSTYKSEIQTLLKCQGGSCPGQPLSPYVVHLLGKTAEGKLVFPAMVKRGSAFHNTVPSIGIYKRWKSHIVKALQALHAINVVHRDLTVDNVMFTKDLQQLVVCDLECHWGSRRAPEILPIASLDAGWTKSRTYSI